MLATKGERVKIAIAAFGGLERTVRRHRNQEHDDERAAVDEQPASSAADEH